MPLASTTSAPFRSHPEIIITYLVLLFTDRFSRRPDMYGVTVPEFTAEGTANVLSNRCIPLWRCPRSILSDNGLQFGSKLSQAVYKLLGV